MAFYVNHNGALGTFKVKVVNDLASNSPQVMNFLVYKDMVV
jgi:hypothetical protein